MGAQNDLVEWGKAFDGWAALWDACPRGDWLLAIAVRRGVSHERIVDAAARCARLGLEHLPEGERLPTRAIELAEAFARGEADDAEERVEVVRALDAAIGDAQDPVIAAASTAALAALLAIESPSDAPLAAAAVAQAAVLDAGECAMLSALGFAQRTCADRVREAIDLAAIDDAAIDDAAIPST